MAGVRCTRRTYVEPEAKAEAPAEAKAPAEAPAEAEPEAPAEEVVVEVTLRMDSGDVLSRLRSMARAEGEPSSSESDVLEAEPEAELAGAELAELAEAEMDMEGS